MNDRTDRFFHANIYSVLRLNPHFWAAIVGFPVLAEDGWSCKTMPRMDRRLLHYNIMYAVLQSIPSFLFKLLFSLHGDSLQASSDQSHHVRYEKEHCDTAPQQVGIGKPCDRAKPLS